MPAALLAVRNMTPTAMKLTLVEHCKSVDGAPNENCISSRSNSMAIFSNRAVPSSPCVVASAIILATMNIDVAVMPFSVVETSVELPSQANGEILRLTFEADAQRYRVGVPNNTKRSQTFSALVSQPKHEFTGVFLPDHTFLAIFSNAQLHCWMKRLNDVTPLSALSIPGTHNSATCYKALPSVRCQAFPPRVQLENGIRFFDVRVQPKTMDCSRLVLVHGVFPISLSGAKYFRDLLNDIVAFLKLNPSEAVIVSVKREGTGAWGGNHLSRVLFDYYMQGNEAHCWYTDPAIPTLGQARGKIVLMRRFLVHEALKANHGGRGWGIDAQCWADNTAHDHHGSVCVQDSYAASNFVNIETKINYCRAQLERASEVVAPTPGITTDPANSTRPHPFYLNFLSASNFWRITCWPRRIAAKLNPAMVDWICRNHARMRAGDGGTGIVICDWVGAGGDWDLVRAVVGFNSLLTMKESQPI